MERFLIVVLFFGLMSGCVNIPRFAYKPAAPATGGSRLPVKIAVLPFVDATENFTTQGSVFSPEGLKLNLVKAGIPGTASALTPELWAKSFADDLTASGDFQSVKFIYSLTELVDEELYIEGTVEKAYAVGSWDKPNEIALGFRALQKADNSPAWEKEVASVWTPKIDMGCGGIECVIEQRYKDINRVMQGLFAEARIDLVRSLASASASRKDEENLLPATSTPAQAESVDGIIEKILKGK